MKVDGVARCIDWETIERDYRLGEQSIRCIAETHGITHGAINKRAKRDGWERDLSEKITNKAAILVSKELVSRSVSNIDPVTEREIVEANAEHVAQVQINERKSIKRQRDLSERLLAEVEAQTMKPELYDQLGELMRDPEANRDRLNEIYTKVTQTSGRIDSFQKLVAATKSLIDLEWKVYRLEQQQTDPASFFEDIMAMARGTGFKPGHAD